MIEYAKRKHFTKLQRKRKRKDNYVFGIGQLKRVRSRKEGGGENSLTADQGRKFSLTTLCCWGCDYEFRIRHRGCTKSAKIINSIFPRVFLLFLALHAMCRSHSFSSTIFYLKLNGKFRNFIALILSFYFLLYDCHGDHWFATGG